MGNLGLYQFMTTAAKAVGGPVAFMAGIGVAGYVVISGAVYAGKVIIDLL